MNVFEFPELSVPKAPLFSNFKKNPFGARRDAGGDEPERGVPGLVGRRVGEPVGPADGGQGRADQDDRRTQAAAVNH